MARKRPSKEDIIKVNLMRDELDALRLAIEILGVYARDTHLNWQRVYIARLEKKADELGKKLEWLREFVISAQDGYNNGSAARRQP